MDKNYIKQMEAHVDEGETLSHKNGVDLLAEILNLHGILRQFCQDLNSAHDELMKAQGIEHDRFDWPEWSPQANSIRGAEEILGEKLAKTDNWTLFPTSVEKTGGKSTK